jgi:prepilin-type N-terminal cleavage/methylation domain-containing protein
MAPGRTQTMRRPTPEQGFSMIELMAAMVVIAIALFGVVSMMTQTMTTRESMREMEVAKEWTLKRIEDVKSQKFVALNTPAAYPAAPGTSQFSGTFGPGVNPAGVPNITDVGTPSSLSKALGTLTVNYANPSLYEIVATISWKGVKGSGTYTMRSLMAP